MKYLSVETLNRLAVKAMDAGVYPRAHRDRGLIGRSLEWDVSGNCRKPVVVELHARYAVDPRRKVKPWWIFMHTRCRCCEACLKIRAADWRQRARQEYLAATDAGCRTWYCTLTYAPDHWAQVLAAARAYSSMNDVDFDGLLEHEKLRACVAETAGEFDRFHKRVRSAKPADLPFRYLWCSERTKLGVLHWHGLIHEVDPDRPIRKAKIQNAWRCGYSNVQLVRGPGAYVYVTKYISKEVGVRVRASQNYGSFSYGKFDSDLDRRRSLIDRRGALTPSEPSFTEVHEVD